MKKKNKVIIFLWVLLIIIPFGAYFIKDKTTTIPGIAYEKGIDIDKYNINMIVKENNEINVVEEITVNLNNKVTSINKVIPKWMEYKNKNNKNVSKRIKIKDVHVTGDQFYLDEYNNRYNLQIGNEKKGLNQGTHTYTIKYTIDMGKDLNKEFDELVFVAFEQQKNISVKNANLVINMPSSIDKKDIKFNSKNIKYNVKNNIISVNTTKEIKSGIMMNITLPDKYFKNTNNNYGISSLFIIIMSLIVSIIILLAWLNNRKNLKKDSKIVRTEPVKEYDTAELGYIYGEQDMNKLATSLIVSLINKGYIHIEKIKKDYILTNIANNYDIEGKSIRVIEVTKHKSIDSSLTNEENNYLDKLFFKDNLYITREFDSFYKEAKSLIKKGYISINDSIRVLDETLIAGIKDDKNPYNTLSKLENLMYNYLFDDKQVVNLSKESLTDVVNNIKEILDITIIKNLNNNKTTSLMKKSIVVSVIIMLLWTIAYLYLNDMNPKLNFLYYISFALLFISSYTSIILERKAPYGEEIISKINGFKKYLEAKDFTKEIEKNPNYLYNIIPYAYVLDMIDSINMDNEYLKDESFKILNKN